MAHRILDSRGVTSHSRRAWVAAATVLAVVGTMLVLASGVAQPAEAASSPTVRFQQNLTGGATMVSNAFHIRSSEGLPNTATPADTDGDPSTSMSSTDLVLPAGSTIVKAFLSAELAYDQTDPSRFDTVRFRVPNGSYVDLGPRSSQFLDRRAVLKTAQVVFDVTGLMPANGYVSTYTPGGERSGQGRYAVAADPSMGGMGGWSLIVVYSNPASTYRSVTVAEDWQQFSNSTVTTDVPGVAVPASGTVKAVVGVTGTYGDPGLSDHVTVGPVVGTGTPLRNPNPTRGLETTDALNSSIGFAATNNVSADGGPAMDGCFAARNPFTGFALPYADNKVTPGCSAQYDATVFDATGAIPASSTPVNVRLTQTSTGGDMLFSGSYFVSVDLAVAVLSKSVAPGRIGDGGVASYTFTVDNSAAGSVRQGGVAFTDVLPAGLRVAAVPNVQVAGASGTPVVDAAPGGARVGVSGLTVEAGAVATIRVNVTNVPGRTNPSCTGDPVDFTNGPGNATIGSGGVINRITPVCVVGDSARRSAARAFPRGGPSRR